MTRPPCTTSAPVVDSAHSDSRAQLGSCCATIALVSATRAISIPTLHHLLPMLELGGSPSPRRHPCSSCGFRRFTLAVARRRRREFGGGVRCLSRRSCRVMQRSKKHTGTKYLSPLDVVVDLGSVFLAHDSLRSPQLHVLPPSQYECNIVHSM